MAISKATFDFLQQLERNNNRDWFLANKPLYEKAHENVSLVLDDLIMAMNTHDRIETASGKKSLMRIYRDVRFSKDKTPYRTRFSGHFKRAGAERRGSYAFNFEPGKCYIGAGFWGPNPADLLTMRKGIQNHLEEFKSIVEAPDFKATFGEIYGDRVKTCPKGFSKEDPALPYLQLKQYLVGCSIPDSIVLSGDFVPYALGIYQKLRPYLDFKSRLLAPRV